MALNREQIVAKFELAFGEEAATQLYHELNEDTKAVMPNTGIFSRKSVHQAIISLVECVTNIKPNPEMAKYWNEIYTEFVKVVPASDVIVAPVGERKRIVILTPEQRAEADAAKAAKELEAKERADAAAAKYTVSSATTNAELEEAAKNDIPF